MRVPVPIARAALRQKRPNIGPAAWRDQDLAKSEIDSAAPIGAAAHVIYFASVFFAALVVFFFFFAITLLLGV